MSDGTVFPGADESTPSLAQYFSWINNTNEGATEEQTLTNLRFFEWLRNEFGMILDVYAFDAGAIDGARFYGSTDSDRFKRQFPRGFGPIAEAAGRLDCRLGIWGGPDGFGETGEDAAKRTEMMVSLCRDHKFILFKFDAVCGHLRPDKRAAFDHMMTECRKHCPDLVLLNHRLELGDTVKHSTTFLLGGDETYIDVHMRNREPAPHNRGGAISRACPRGLTRMTEDHGVCLSSCLDYWEDDLVLQAFNRCTILSPQIYGNPWLLADHEFPRLARIYNLHRRYRHILVDALELQEEQYGPHALSRGDGKTRFLALRNLSWEAKTLTVEINESIGLAESATAEIRRMHPFERVLGTRRWGDQIEIEVGPYRACLLMVTTKANDEIGFEGCNGEVIRDIEGKPARLKLWGLPGTASKVRVHSGRFPVTRMELDGQPANALAVGMDVSFGGNPWAGHWHLKLGDLGPCDVPQDSSNLLEATFYSADNNALEIRELQRSGKTAHTCVRRAREAFFGQERFRARGVWDRNLFDDDPGTFFSVSRRYGDERIDGGYWRLDFGRAVRIDRLVLGVGGDYFLQPLKAHEGVPAQVSADLRNWFDVTGFCNSDIEFKFDSGRPVRYIRFRGPDRVREVRGYYQGQAIDRTSWRATNLFPRPRVAESAFHVSVLLGKVHAGSYLAVPIFGRHGCETVYAAAICEGEYMGAARRAPSYPSNTFEGPVRTGDGNYTYYIPLNPRHAGRPIDIYVLASRAAGLSDVRCEAWITAFPAPYVSRDVILFTGSDQAADLP